jgi:hypothetical protein
MPTVLPTMFFMMVKVTDTSERLRLSSRWQRLFGQHQLVSTQLARYASACDRPQ